MESWQITFGPGLSCVIIALKQITPSAAFVKLGSFQGATFFDSETKLCNVLVTPSGLAGRTQGWVLEDCLLPAGRRRATLVLLRVRGIAVLVTSTVSWDASHAPSDTSRLCTDAKPPGTCREIKAGWLLLSTQRQGKEKAKDVLEK